MFSSLAFRRALLATACVALVALSFWNLADYPVTWFDEGIHLHVPKALLRFGVYADYSSEGFRYYGPTMTVGPAVMLPETLALKWFGMGLFQARSVIVLYMLVAIALFYAIGRQLGGPRLAIVATILLLASRGVELFYFGRQVLGEVPALAFCLAGIGCWFRSWERGSRGWLIVAGLLMGLAVTTKYQYVFLLGPGLCVAWLANRVYYRTLRDRDFLYPLVLLSAAFAAWQAIGLVYLGPSVVGDNFRLMRSTAAGAAALFSPAAMARSLGLLVHPRLYASLLLPAVAYAAYIIYARRDRTIAAQRWATILAFVTPHLVWFAIASIGWVRYAFPALVLGAFLVARLLLDAVPIMRRAAFAPDGRTIWPRAAIASGVAAFVLLLLIAPAARTIDAIAHPSPNYAGALAGWLEENVSHDALVETWEPELEFLTDHRYHYPPPSLLIHAVAFRWAGEPATSRFYNFAADGLPAFVVEGPFSRWTNVFQIAPLHDQCRQTASFGGYVVYACAEAGGAGSRWVTR